MSCVVCKREAADLLEKVDALRDLIIDIGGLASRGVVIATEEVEQLMGALYDLRLIREALDSGEGDEDEDDQLAAAARDLAVLEQVAEARRATQ
jgi:hypothetical protein